MALDFNGLKTAIADALKKMKDPNLTAESSAEADQTMDDLANDLAAAIEDYVKSGTVSSNIDTGAVAGSGAAALPVVGTATGTIE